MKLRIPPLLTLILTLTPGISFSQTADLDQDVTVFDQFGRGTNIPLSLLESANLALSRTNQTARAEPRIRVDAAGATADYGFLQVRFTANLAESRPITITTRRSQTIAFRPTCIALVRRSTGEAWLVAQITNSVAEIAASEVAYREAFSELSAELRYAYAENGKRLEQFITIGERIALPSELKDCEADVDLECWTEFFLENDPLSIQETSILLRAAGAGASAVQATDQSTDFGGMRIPGGGIAFGIGNETDTVPVAKTWIGVDSSDGAAREGLRPGRFLCERTDWLTIKPRLQNLPTGRAHASFQKLKSRQSLLASLTQPAVVSPSQSPPIRIARSFLPVKRGLVIDFAVVAPEGLIAWWKADGNAFDAQGTFDGATQGGMGYAAAEVGQGFGFDGIDDWVLVDPAPPLNFGPGTDLSIEGWINATAATTMYGVQMILDKRVTTLYDDGSLGYALYLVNGQLGCQLADAPLASYQYHAYGPAGPDLRGSYHHVGMTVDRDSTSGGKLYVDGNLVLTFDPTSEQGDLSNDGPLRIGKHATAGVNAPFKGIIDELSLYNRVLSQAELQAVFNAGVYGKAVAPSITVQPLSQSVAAGGNVTFSVVAAGTPPFNYQWVLNGQGICGATTSAYTRNSVQAADQGAYWVLVSNPGGSRASAGANLTVSGGGGSPVGVPSGLVSWWRAECDASDAALMNPGTLMNGGAFSGGKVGQGFSLNGASRFVRVPSSPSLQLTGEFTLECWYKDTGASWFYGLVAKRAPAAPYTTTFGINIWPNNLMQIYFLDPTYVNFQICDYSPVPSPNLFHHIAGTFKQTDPTHVEIKAYIDGACVKTVTRSGNLANCHNDVPVTIGASTEAAEFMVGIIDEVSIYSRALSATEILGIYNSGVVGKSTVDVDGDGLPDAWEQQHFGNLLARPEDDADRDGLTNMQEYLAGADPKNPDSDRDGRTDGQEVLVDHTNPTDPGSHVPRCCTALEEIRHAVLLCQ